MLCCAVGRLRTGEERRGIFGRCLGGGGRRLGFGLRVIWLFVWEGRIWGWGWEVRREKGGGGGGGRAGGEMDSVDCTGTTFHVVGERYCRDISDRAFW